MGNLMEDLFGSWVNDNKLLFGAMMNAIVLH
jgi:hypothetical protein